MIIGIDIGGTKTLVAGFEKHEIIREEQFATSQDSEVFLSDLLPLVESYASQGKLEAVAVAAPGIIDYENGRIIRCGNLPWKDVTICEFLRKKFDCPVYLDNDANLAGLAEAQALHPVPQLCLYLTVSTGIGSGIIVNGQLLPALRNSEPGHMPLRRGSHFVKWEHFASGKALLERTGSMAADLRDDAAWRDQAERVCDGLLTLIPILSPSVIIFGGSIGGYFDHRWRRHLEELLEERLPPIFDTPPPVMQAQYPREAVVYGCARYAQQQLNAR